MVIFYRDPLYIYAPVTIEKAVAPLNCLQGRTTLESLLSLLMPDLALRKRTHIHTHTHAGRKRKKKVE